MAASRDTRYHEAAHAVAAELLGIGLKEEGMILHSDSDARVEVIEVPANERTEDWCVRRVAVKLAGPVAMCRQGGQEPDWGTLKCEREYSTDHNDSERIFRDYWAGVGGGGGNDLIAEQMNRSRCMAVAFVEKNEAAISAVADATKDRDEFSRSEIIACIRACQDWA